MPRLLKRETIQRLNTSQQALRLAFSLLSTPKPLGYKRLPTDGALEIGLAGIAAELALAACLYELYGESGIVRQNGFYLTASEALAHFRQALSSSVLGLSSITSGVPDSIAHLQRIEEACSTFPVLFSARAAALHAGAGTSHDVAFCAAKAAADFLLLLADSTKWSPYLRDVPAIPQLPKDRQLIAQELAALAASPDSHTAAGALSGIFLVLPEMSNSEPEWIDALQRVQVTPRKNDIGVLIKALQNAQVGDIFKVGKGKMATPVTIGPPAANTFAIPIYPQAMKKKFENLNDQWSAYVAMANPALDKNILSLPPVQAVYRFASVGIENIGLPDEETKGGLSSHSVWPFIASALAYQGTKGPCFFVARALKPSESGQMNALLTKASALSGGLSKTLGRYQPLLMATIEKNPVEPTLKMLAELQEAVERRKERRNSLIERLEELSEKPWNDGAIYNSVCDVLQQSDSVGHVLRHIVNGQLSLGALEVPILRRLIEAADDIDSIAIMAEIESDGRFSTLATPIRKAIRDIDYAHYGPKPKQ